MLAEPSPNQNEITTLISWNFWPLNGPSMKDSMSTSMMAHFDVFTDNNPLTYILTSAKLDAVGQQWVASLGPYNFSLHYNQGRQNTVADSLSRIPWKNAVFYNEVHYNVVKAVVHKGEVNSNSNIEPETYL